MYILNYFGLHNKSWAIHVWSQNYADMKVLCLILYFITDIVVKTIVLFSKISIHEKKPY